MSDRTASPPDAAALLARDPFARSMGIELVEGRPGHVKLRMTVDRRHMNFNGACHGAVTFAVADTAFGLACNAGRSLAAAIDSHITYTAPVWEGDELIATATELSRSKRVTTYRVEVMRYGDERVASFVATAFVTDRAAGSGDDG